MDPWWCWPFILHFSDLFTLLIGFSYLYLSLEILTLSHLFQKAQIYFVFFLNLRGAFTSSHHSYTLTCFKCLLSAVLFPFIKKWSLFLRVAFPNLYTKHYLFWPVQWLEFNNSLKINLFFPIGSFILVYKHDLFSKC